MLIHVLTKKKINCMQLYRFSDIVQNFEYHNNVLLSLFMVEETRELNDMQIQEK